VILEVEGKWRIPVGSRAQLVSTGIMDPRTVEIVPGPGPGEIGEGAVLPGSVAKSLFDDTESLGGKGMEVLDQIAALLSDSTIQSVDEGARYLEGILEEIAGVMGSESEEIKGLITALGSAAEDLAGATPELREELLGTVVRADSLVVTLTERVSDFEGTMASLSSVLDRINNGQGTLGKLSTDDELFHSLKDALESARFLMDDLRENPRRYINISIF
jgi:phospholipid/cholesterol/gamma-HCH transport system substrate-binding protein